ncbi:cytochrome P450 [Aspergillus homomorphus CBS 101889]|uniref:Cytochrome protein n=1 Tax=Aspergillus homomorphus (strain CBS 101889) TaxID=1450537 RepID=A0A395I7U6_ASPHC|nr:cytochrome protein [Aspergillus homomorphus CBS 101889]RAL15138.1 cytochrome protein [Aspergillus homomorphus CBS 101889]
MESPIVDYLRVYGGPAALTLGLIVLLRGIYRLVRVRLLFHHLLAKHPKGSQQSDAFTVLSYNFPEFDNCFYIDIWPFVQPLLCITSPDLAVQVCQTYALPKPAVLQNFFQPFTGGWNIFTTNGPEWKRARSLFNPAFSASAVLHHTSQIVEEAQVYVDILREHATKGDTFSLDRMTCSYVMDIIGSIAINKRLKSQREYNPLAAAMRSVAEWNCQDEELNPFIRWNPLRPIMHWYNGRTMTCYIGDALEERYQRWRQNQPSDRHRKSIMDLVIADFMSTRSAKEDRLDPEFKAWATIQVRTFLFAGHDSTAATIVYSIYMLSKHPELLARVRAEHDQVFGDVSSTAQTLTQHPELINQLPLTLAVIKETLRLFPAASALRWGQPGVHLQDQNGTKYPTDGLCIWILHGAIQRNPNYWKDPSAFLPERWLVGPDHPLYPPKGGWRAFEQGPRDCIGQTLALLDIKVTLLLVLREFDFQDQYAEWDRLHPSAGPNTVFGERAYQVPQGASHPAQGMPCRVSQRQHIG